MTIRKDILTAMKAAADTAPSVAGRVYRSRTAAIARNEGSVVIIRPADESVNPIEGVAERDFHVQVLVITRGEVPDDIADTIIGEVHEAFAADPSFGGLAAQLFEESSRWSYSSADESACELDVRYRVRLYTPENSLSQPLS